MVDRYFCNCRGLNYVAVYPELWDTPPTDLGTFSYEASVGGIPIGSVPISETYRGVASPIAMWRWYTPSDVNTHFGYLKGIGVNCVRVWLSYFVWHEHEKGLVGPDSELTFLQALESLASIADIHRIRVIWVLWDGFGGDPKLEYPYTSIDQWYSQPGEDLATSSFFYDGSAFTYTVAGSITTDVNFQAGKLYVTDVINTVKDHQCTLMYDIMNEPIGDSFLTDFVTTNAEFIRTLDTDTSHKITIGFAGARPYDNNVSSMMNSPFVDVLSFHPYNITTQAFNEVVRLAELLSENLDTEKPLFTSEGGSPGIYMRYEKFMEHCRSQNLGFVSFGAMIDDPQSQFPVKGKSGYFHPDGTIRDPLAITKFMSLGQEDGVLPTFTPVPIERTEYTDANVDTIPEDFTPYDSELTSAGTASEKLANLSYYIWTGQAILDDIVTRADWTHLHTLTTDSALLKEYMRQVSKLTTITIDLNLFFETALGIRGGPYAANLFTEEEEVELKGYLDTLGVINVFHPNFNSCLNYSNPDDRTCFFIKYDIQTEGLNTFSLIQEDNEVFTTENDETLDFEHVEEFLFLTEDNDLFVSEDDDFLEQEESNTLEEGFLLEEDYPVTFLATENEIDWVAYDDFLEAWSNTLGRIITLKGITA